MADLPPLPGCLPGSPCLHKAPGLPAPWCHLAPTATGSPAHLEDHAPPPRTASDPQKVYHTPGDPGALARGPAHICPSSEMGRRSTAPTTCCPAPPYLESATSASCIGPQSPQRSRPPACAPAAAPSNTPAPAAPCHCWKANAPGCPRPQGQLLLNNSNPGARPSTLRATAFGCHRGATGDGARGWAACRQDPDGE